MSAGRIFIEPARYAMTGGGMHLYLMRDGFEDQIEPGHCIDAPDYLPTGGLCAGLGFVNGLPPVWTTEERES